ncbi:hypothetical protein XELAEV_18007896mg [Xenopus laevis]|uniref:Uncharacterized protein n=1 Tax=Xenopus laevis TaxID=8355 RepID=A0A974E1P4_XENLA|nr:hypothetical protein XELAEV_18007896mg [Xenopus laevis]
MHPKCLKSFYLIQAAFLCSLPTFMFNFFFVQSVRLHQNCTPRPLGSRFPCPKLVSALGCRYVEKQGAIRGGQGVRSPDAAKRPKVTKTAEIEVLKRRKDPKSRKEAKLKS